MNEIAMETDALGKRYGKTWALQDCSLSLPCGKIAGLVGPNGAGKTTLIHLAVGLLKPTTGMVRVAGLNPTWQMDKVLPKVGFVGQERPIYRSFSVGDLLQYGKKMNPRWDGAYALQHMAKLDIPLNQAVGKLSGGQQAQVALMLAMAKRPEMLFLDEPVASLDPLARHAFFQSLMDYVAESGIAVLFSSHQVADLYRLCDNLILLSASHLQLNGPIEQLLQEHRWIICPLEQQAEVESMGQPLKAIPANRSVKLMIRAQAFNSIPEWDVQTVSLEDLILAYLALPGTIQHPFKIQSQPVEADL